MRVRVLGPIEVRAGPDWPWTSPTPQQRMVLGALAAPAGRARDLVVLREALWADEPPDNAHRLVQALVSRLRSSLGQPTDADGPLRSVEGGWRLDLDPDELDATSFDREVERATGLLARGDIDAAGQTLDRALEAWRGRPFGDLADEPCVAAEAARLEERRLDAVQVRLKVRLAVGANGPAITELKELLTEHPLREQLWVLLMTALYRAGRQAEALVAYQRIRRRLVDELGVEPGPDLQRLHARILRHEVDGGDGGGPATLDGATESPGVPEARRGAGVSDVAPTAVRGLPVARTSFVGRDRERTELARILRTEQVVTVLGPGGVGKTRLATTVADQVGTRFARGGAFVDLTRVEPDRLTRAVARALAVVERPDETLAEALVDHVRRGPLLLVLDNCEHQLDEVADLVDELVGASRDLVVLATSRERIGLDGERVHQLHPLPLDDAVDVAAADPASAGRAPDAAVDPGDPSGSDAVRLFLDRTRAVAPDFHADPAQLADLCRRLDGLPLAIELAAARAGSLGIEGLQSGLDDRLRLLRVTGGGRARHRSLRAVLDWSHDLLDEQEQATLRRLAVFTGPFDLVAATAVAGGGPSGGPPRGAVGSQTTDLVGRLVDKSLLVHLDVADHSRWMLLDVVRDYGLERLAESGETAMVRDRHLRWAVEAALDLTDRMQSGADWRASFRRVEGDLRAALDAVPADARSDRQADSDAPRPGVGQRDACRLELAFAVASLQARTASYRAAQDAYEAAIGLARSVGGADELARAALGASVSGMVFGVSDRRRVDWLEEALAAQGDAATGLGARLQARLSMELYWSEDRPRSLALADEALTTARRVGDDAAQAQAMYALHYTSRGPEGADERVALSSEVVERAERGGVAELALAGRAAHVVDLLAVGDLTGMDAALGMLWEAAERLQRPAFQWYTDVYRVVRALLEGRFEDADALAATAIAAGRNVTEFTVGLFFAEAVTDLRDPTPSVRRHRAARLDDMATRFPRVLVWRCLALLNELALVHPGPRTVVSDPLPTARHDGVRAIRAAGRDLADDVLDRSTRDAHWLVEACLLGELAAELGDVRLAARLDESLRPHAERLAVAGRVGACRGAVSHALGLLRWTLEDLDGAVVDLDVAATMHGRIGARPHLARSLVALARVRELRDGPGDRATAAAARERIITVGRELRLSMVDSAPG